MVSLLLRKIALVEPDAAAVVRRPLALPQLVERAGALGDVLCLLGNMTDDPFCQHVVCETVARLGQHDQACLGSAIYRVGCECLHAGVGGDVDDHAATSCAHARNSLATGKKYALQV